MSHLREVNLHSVVQGGSLAALSEEVTWGWPSPNSLPAEEQEPGNPAAGWSVFLLCVY